MNCRECSAQVEANDLVCGNCGALLERSRQAVPSTQPIVTTQSKVVRRISTSTLLIFVFSCGLLALIVASAVGGVVVGLRDRDAEQQAQADKFYQEGVVNFAAGRLELAKADFNYVLQVRPNYPGAREQLSQVENRLNVKPTPTSPALNNAIEQLYQTAVSAYQAEKWATAIGTLSQLRSIDPAYQQDAVRQMLFDAAATYGEELLQTDRLEEGIAYLDQAAYVKPLAPQIAQELQYAKLYLTARGYWNVNWETAIAKFSELYTTAPGYRDVFVRLVGAYIEYGNERVRAGDACTAQQQYASAQQLRQDVTIQIKLDQATQVCLTATPAPISGTAQTLVGLFLGRIAYPTDGGRIDVGSVGNPVYAAGFGDQPELQRNGSQLTYRTGAGINVGNRSIATAGAAWPTFSPDGSRIIYSAQGRLYMINIDSGNNPIDLGPGTAPTWGPNGLLAYAGCDAAGACGIMIRNPDQSDAPVRLTGSAKDIPSSWSPDGFNISYYSNVSGDYDLFFVNTAGGVQQVTSGPGNDIAGSWGPDGAHVAFLSDRDGTWSLYLAKYDGSEITEIAIAPQGASWVNQRVSWVP